VDAQYKRSVAEDVRAIRQIAIWLEGLLIATDMGDDALHDVQVCVEEALANLILHARAEGAAKDIEIEFAPEANGACVVISDACVSFDVSAAPLPEGDGIGGHGLRLMRAFASDIAYARVGSRNVLRLTFRRGRDTASELIRAIPDLTQANPEAIVALTNLSAPVRFLPGETLMVQGAPSEHAFVLLTGTVEVVNANAHGEAPLARIEAPALIGEVGALAGLSRTATVRAVTSVRALQAPRAALLETGRQTPDVLVSVIARMGGQLLGINNALGLYAAGLAALERDDFDPAILDDLNNPSAELSNFAAAFRGLARRVVLERRTRGEMANAAVIQAAMLPAPLDPTALAGRCDAYGAMKAAREVGGDLFDLFMIDERRLGVVIGDVCGKGVPAALFMCATVTALRLAARQCSDLEEAVSVANAALCAQNAASMFTTLVYGVLDLETGTFEYVNCGHNSPLLRRADGSIAELDGRAPPLGFFPDQIWSRRAVAVAPGDCIFLFTDGVTECVDASGAEYGEDRLQAILTRTRDLGASALVEAVMEDVTRFSTTPEPFDDVTCVALLMPSAAG
jgi:phosphoserine phosphatase RsbU/P